MFDFDDGDVPDDVREEALFQRRRDRYLASTCPECRHSRGAHATGCPEAPDRDDDDAQDNFDPEE